MDAECANVVIVKMSHVNDFTKKGVIRFFKRALVLSNGRGGWYLRIIKHLFLNCGSFSQLVSGRDDKRPEKMVSFGEAIAVHSYPALTSNMDGRDI